MKPGPAAIAGAFALSLGFAPARAADPFALIPSSADPGTPFRAMLAAARYQCNYDFKGDTAFVSGKEIRLAFVAEENPAVKCAASVVANGPTFTIPALAAGVYAVYAEPMPPCAISPQPCPFALIREFVDSLRVAPGSTGTENKWFIRPRTTSPLPHLELQVLNWGYASCETIFTGVTWELRSGGVHMDYDVAFTRRLCVLPLRPYGMILPLEGLKPGRYPVFVSRNHCNPYVDACAVPSEAVVDTLTVTGATAIAGARPPADAGSYARAEIFDRLGRRVGGSEAERRRGLAPGVYFLRATAPGRATESRAIVLP